MIQDREWHLRRKYLDIRPLLWCSFTPLPDFCISRPGVAPSIFSIRDQRSSARDKTNVSRVSSHSSILLDLFDSHFRTIASPDLTAAHPKGLAADHLLPFFHLTTLTFVFPFYFQASAHAAKSEYLVLEETYDCQIGRARPRRQLSGSVPRVDFLTGCCPHESSPVFWAKAFEAYNNYLEVFL